jgi:hypothetical protein
MDGLFFYVLDRISLLLGQRVYAILFGLDLRLRMKIAGNIISVLFGLDLLFPPENCKGNTASCFFFIDLFTDSSSWVSAGKVED